MERTITVSEARGKLLELTRQIKNEMEKFILTNKGEPQAVLLSVSEYNSLLAASQLLAHPGVLEQIWTGMEQLKRENSLSMLQAFNHKRLSAEAGKC